MKECWINVYSFPSGFIWHGSAIYNTIGADSVARACVRNGCKFLYRIHVRMK